MSVSTYRRRVNRLRKEKNTLEDQANEEKEKERKLNGQILHLERTLAKSSNESTIARTKQRIQTKAKAVIKARKQWIDLGERIRKKDDELSRAEESLADAKSNEDMKRREKELNDTSLLNRESLSDESLSTSEDGPKTKPPRRGGPIPTPEEQKQEYIKGWEEAQHQMTQQAYCDSKNIAPSTLRRWLRSYRAKSS